MAKKKSVEAVAEAATEGAIIAYKAFDKNLQCRGFQYEVGKTFTHSGPVRHCDSGFHSCEDPLDVLRYYDITESRFAVVRASGEISREQNGDSKIASAVLHIEAELTMPDFIKRSIQWIKDACKIDPGHSATNASSGHSAKNASSGDYAKNASSGDSATNASSGHSATNASSGHSAKNASSGDSAKNEAAGQYSVIAAAGCNTLAKGAKGVWISLAEYTTIDGEWRCCGFAVGQAGHGDVPADVWLKAENGKLVVAQ